MTLPVKANTSFVYVDFGRWLAMCPCSNATEFGTPGDPPILSSVWRCVECGGTNEIIWPDVDMMHGIVRLLSLRPYRKNRNWFPNETLVDLMNENNEHLVGIEQAMLENPDGGVLLRVSETAIVTDRLPLPAIQRPELEWSTP